MSFLDHIRTNITKSQEAIESTSDGFDVAVYERKRAELRVGMNAQGLDIIPSYDPSWAEYKNTLNSYNAPSGTPDLYHTGKFHKSILATRKGYAYDLILVNPPEYADAIMARYNEPNGISEIGENDLDNKYLARLTNELQKIWR